MKTIDNARKAAETTLISLGCTREDPPDADATAQATAAYMRSLIRDGDIGYLCELIGEHADGFLLKRFSLIAQALETNHTQDYAVIGEHDADGAYSYLAAEIESVIESLPCRADIHADDYDEDHHRELRATA